MVKPHIWHWISGYIRHKISVHSHTEPELKDQLNILHKGFFVGLLGPDGKRIYRKGFMNGTKNNILDSADAIIPLVVDDIKHGNLSQEDLDKYPLMLTVVLDMKRLKNSLEWDPNRDGVYFQWGDKYEGLYLPFEIKAMNVSQNETMDRLCSWEVGVPATFWRLAEGLTWQIVCESHPS